MTPTDSATVPATKPDLPAGWRRARLGEVCEDNIETRDPRLAPEKPFHYVDITSVDNIRKRIVSSRTLLGRDAPSRARQVIRDGDVIVSTTRPNLNAVAVVPPNLDDQICSTGFCVLRVKSDLDRDYLFAFVQSEEFVEGLSALVRGALYPAVTDRQVHAQCIPLPPLPDQKRIAAILNEQMAAVERARAAAEAQLEAAKALPAAYLRAVFTSPEAQRWPKKPLGEVCEIIAGQSPPGGTYRKTPEGVPFFQGKADFGSRYPVARVWCVAPTKIALPGDILISVRAPVGPTNVADVKCCIGRGLAAIRPGEQADRDFVLAALKLLEGKIAELGSGSTFEAIRIEDLESLEIPLPPLDEQKRIAAILNDQMAVAEKTRKALEEQLAAINALPAAFLRRTFRGEL